MDICLTNKAYCWDLQRVERLNSELLMRVMVLEGHQGDLIEIPDSPVLILIPPPGGNLLVEIVDGTDDEAMQAAVEDMVEAVNHMEGEEVKVLGVEGEIFEDSEDVLDVLRWVVAREQEIPQYQPPPTYDDVDYIPDRQV